MTGSLVKESDMTDEKGFDRRQRDKDHAVICGTNDHGKSAAAVL